MKFLFQNRKNIQFGINNAHAESEMKLFAKSPEMAKIWTIVFIFVCSSVCELMYNMDADVNSL